MQHKKDFVNRKPEVKSKKAMKQAQTLSSPIPRKAVESGRENLAKETLHGEARRARIGRTLGAATKDNRHGLHTDHTASRRSESRRQGYMGSESKGKQNRENI